MHDELATPIPLLPLALVAALAAACVGEIDPVPEEVVAMREDLSLRGTQRVVIARMFQRDTWAIEAADAYRADELPRVIDRRIAYVCDAIAPLRPTYVSGLVRLRADEPISEEQATVFEGVKRCIRRRVDHRVRFDVVLNALHYTDPDHGITSRRQGRELLLDVVRDANARLDPDGYFFDFYSAPWTVRGHRFHPAALLDGIRGIHRMGRFVGGNVMRNHVPEGSDFVAITDRGGREEILRKVEGLRDRGIPVMLHIRNDPHIPGTSGLLWTSRSRAYRKRILRRHVRWSERHDFTYMYPVFFPFSERQVAYDAVRDGNMLSRIEDYMEGGERRRRLTAATGADAVPSAYDPEDDGLVPVHRALRPSSGQHLFSPRLGEIEDDEALSLEREAAFSLAPAAASDTAALRRCDLGDDGHLLTVREGCEGVLGAVDEGVIGHLAVRAAPGTAPLRRLSRADGRDRFFTVDPSEAAIAVALGYRDEGVIGHAWVDEIGGAFAPDEPVGEAGAPGSRVAVHRAYHRERRQHLYTIHRDEVRASAGLALEAEGYFHLESGDSATGPALHRCDLGGGWHLLTTHPGCEGAPGAVREGTLGHLADAAGPDTTPLFRLFHAGVPNHFFTISAAERDHAVSLGYRDAGVVGHVYVRN